MKKIILFIVGLVCATIISTFGQTVPHPITGTVLSARDGTPLAGASIFLQKSGASAVTDANGNFSIQITIVPDTLIVSHIGYREKQVIIQNPSVRSLTIRLKASSTRLQEVTVSTGYQQIPRERATGSFDFIDNKLLNRSVSPDILSRLKGVASGLLFDKNTGNTLDISIRGRSTIFANTQPLIVLDNFPYDGNIDDINPNDVESITILKDAAAASIWGARAGNGVIVITTKKGSYNQPMKVSINSNVTASGMPDLFNLPLMRSSDYIDVETYLFNHGYYNSLINSARMSALSPVVDLLNKKRNGEISAADATSRINMVRNQDVRHDFMKYLYRHAVNQQYAVNLSGGGLNQRYYLSVGYDNDLNSLVGDQYKRYTISANSTYALLKHKLHITTGINFEQSPTSRNGLSPATLTFGSYGFIYPYARLAGAEGQALSIPKYNQGYIDTVGSGKLLDWNYRPLDELKYSNYTTKGIDYRLNLDIKYQILKGLNVTVKYLYQKEETDIKNLHNQYSFYTRDYINQFSEIDKQSGQVIRPVPLGAILDIDHSSAISQDLRGQLNYTKTWDGKNQLTTIAGAEIGNASTEGSSYRFYGYDPIHATSIPVDYVNRYPNYITGSEREISNQNGITVLTNRDVSMYANAAYTYDSRYTISGSARKDASNLFGVNANQRWVPLWSIGAAWNLADEGFYHIRWLPYLKLRTTYGYSGNVDKTVTALLTSRLSDHNIYGVTHAMLVNPPNPDLQWERVSQINFAIDYATSDNHISGSVEYYRKKGTDLMGYAPLAPSTGLTSYKGNTSDMKGDGIDFILRTINIDRGFKWHTTLLFSYARDWVTNYKVKASTINSYISASLANPLVGKPVSALYSFRWGGLDPRTGGPEGYENGKISEDYSTLITSGNLEDMAYSGPTAPPIFGSMQNTFSLKQFTLSFILTYKGGYYFRRNSINYNQLFTRLGPGYKDYERRWEKPGDEKKTNVPSMIYPDNSNRDHFYQYSSILVEKGDNIRLQDVRLSYELIQQQVHNLPFSSIKFYLYANNLGVLWKANQEGIDPDFNPDRYYEIPTPISLSIGANIKF